MTAFAKKKGAPAMTSGAPGDRTCLTSKCHAGNELNTDKATILVAGLPKAYTPNEIYEITLSLQQVDAKKFGFIASAADVDGNAIGTLMSDDETKTQVLSDDKYKSRTNRQYVSHTEKAINASSKGSSPTWKLTWQAPAEGAATSNFYFAFNAANGNKKKTGDYIYTRSFEVPVATD